MPRIGGDGVCTASGADGVRSIVGSSEYPTILCGGIGSTNSHPDRLSHSLMTRFSLLAAICSARSCAFGLFLLTSSKNDLSPISFGSPLIVNQRDVYPSWTSIFNGVMCRL